MRRSLAPLHWLFFALSLGGCNILLGLDEYERDTGTDGVGGQGGAGVSSSSSSGGGGGGGLLCAPNEASACYSGPESAAGKGDCKLGTHTCAPDGMSYSACMGDVMPGVEDCYATGDEDCDGVACSELLWSKALGGTANQHVNLVTTDPQGNMIMVGGFYGSIKYDPAKLAIAEANAGDLFVIKLDKDGKPIFGVSFGSTMDETATGVATDANGNIIVVGFFQGTFNFGAPMSTVTATKYGGFLVKLDPNGKVLWSNVFDGIDDDYLWGVAVDLDGDVVAVGQRAPTNGSKRLIISKYKGVDGAQQWSILDINGGGDRIARAVGVDGAKNILVAGSFAGAMSLYGGSSLTSVDGTDVFLAKITGNQSYAWVKQYGGVGDQGAESLAIDSNQDIVIAGWNGGTIDLGSNTFMSSGNNKDAFVAKFNTNPIPIWSRAFRGDVPSHAPPVADLWDQKAYRVAVDSQNNVLLAGEFTGYIDFSADLTAPIASQGGSDIFLAKLDKAGNTTWAKGFGDASDKQFGYGVAAGLNDQIFLVAQAFGHIDFGNGTPVPLPGEGGDVDIFVASFQP